MSIIILTAVLPIVSAGLFDFFKKDPQLSPNPSTDVQLQIGNSAPSVTISSVDDNIAVQDDIVNLQAGAQQSVRIIFDVEDPNGPPSSNLDESSLSISFDLDAGGESYSGTILDCTSNDNVNVRTYTCDINFDYFTDDGAWTASVDIDDTSGSPLTGSDTHPFTVAPLLDITITTPINFGTVAAGQLDVTGISTTISNNGNFIVPTDGNVEVLSGSLGSVSVVDTISSTQFNARGTGLPSGDVCLTGPNDGTTLVNGFVPTAIANTNLPKGSAGNNEETLSYCLDVPNVAEASFSAVDGDGVWTIRIS